MISELAGTYGFISHLQYTFPLNMYVVSYLAGWVDHSDSRRFSIRIRLEEERVLMD
jgi:hypothetical protein